MVIRNIVEQHSQEAAFLWLLREQTALSAPHYSLQDMADLEERIEAHIDGLRIAGDVGWEVSEQDLSIEQAGEIFVAAVLAFESTDKQKIDKVIALVDKRPDFIAPLVSALAWVDIQIAKPVCSSLLNAKESRQQQVGLLASIKRGQSPLLKEYPSHVIVVYISCCNMGSGDAAQATLLYSRSTGSCGSEREQSGGDIF